ncbi:MAG: hypothetical protein ACXABY_37125, partial [Candidatus Thorarchaeota archaeon]
TYTIEASITNSLDSILDSFIGLDLGPVLYVDKWLFEQADQGDGDGILEVGEEWWFNVVIEVHNISGVAIEEVLLKDNIAGDLLAFRYGHPGSGGWIDVPVPTEKSKKDNIWTDGFITIEWTGKTKKAHVYFDLGSLDPGQATFVQLWLITDINTGTGKGKKAGHQEYTSPGLTELNSGATAKGLIEGWLEVEAESASIEVDVQPQDLP